KTLSLFSFNLKDPSPDSKIRYNITKAENEVLHSLDLMNTSDYVGEIRSQLSDDQFYKKLQFDPVRHFKLETDKFISNAFEYAEISETEKSLINVSVIQLSSSPREQTAKC
uniref:Uncharacterized protein n=1 Tax=Cyprinus carpio TaxID=7962 RepID=A0A8C2ASF7_CYPCA